MRKILIILGIILLASCGSEDDSGDNGNGGTNTNNNIPPSSPILITPNNNSTITITFPNEFINFEWEAVTDPDGDFKTYMFYYDDDISFNNPSYSGGNNPFRDVHVQSFQPNTTYYWKVVAIDFNGNSNESNIWSFVYIDGNSPSQPQLVFPLHETECSNDNLTFDWYASNDPSGSNIDYKLHISTSPSFDNNVDIYTTSNTLYNVILPQSTALYWKVEAINSSNNSSFSESRSLYTQGDGTTNTIPQIGYTSPENGAIISDQSPPLQWQASDNETSNANLSYKVYFSEVGQDLVLMYEDNDITSYEVSGLDFGTTYQWSVWVTDEDGATNVGEVYTFTVQ